MNNLLCSEFYNIWLHLIGIKSALLRKRKRRKERERKGNEEEGRKKKGGKMYVLSFFYCWRDLFLTKCEGYHPLNFLHSSSFFHCWRKACDSPRLLRSLVLWFTYIKSELICREICCWTLRTNFSYRLVGLHGLKDVKKNPINNVPNARKFWQG